MSDIEILKLREFIFYFIYITTVSSNPVEIENKIFIFYFIYITTVDLLQHLLIFLYLYSTLFILQL